MYNNKVSELLINSFIDIHRQHHSFIAQHHDQLREHALDFSNAYIDQSLNLLKYIHLKISQDKSNSNSLDSIALIQTLINNASHFKATMTHHKQPSNIHKQILRRLAMGVMTGFGVMSGTHAANDLSESSTYFEKSASKTSPQVVFFDDSPENSTYLKEPSSLVSVETSLGPNTLGSKFEESPSTVSPRVVFFDDSLGRSTYFEESASAASSYPRLLPNTMRPNSRNSLSVASPNLRLLLDAQSPNSTRLSSDESSRINFASSESKTLAAANLDQYKKHLEDLNEWRKSAASSEKNTKLFFFETLDDNSELTAQAILQLQYDYLIEHPEINIPDLKNFGLFNLSVYEPNTGNVKTNIEQMKHKLLNQSLAAFNQGQKLYTSIVQMGGAGSGHYTLVVIENDGTVHMINTWIFN